MRDDRLLYVIGNLCVGGEQRQLCYLLRGITRLGGRPIVVVWSFSEQDVHVGEVRDLGVPLHGFPPSLHPLAKLKAIHDLSRRYSPRIIHSYSFYTNVAAYWAGLRTGAVAIGSLRSDAAWIRTQNGALLGRCSARWPRLQISNNHATAALRPARSPFAPAKLWVVPNGINVASWRSLPFRSDGGTTICGIGTLTAVKRWDRLLSITAALRQSGVNVQLRIAGEGPLLEPLKDRASALAIREQVEFLGHSADVAAVLGESAMLVHTSDSEGCPNAVMEAMACGRAVVAGNVGDVPFLVEEGTTGFVVPSHDEPAFVEKIARLIHDPGLRRRMGNAGRRRIEEHFTMDRLVADTLRVYDHASRGASPQEAGFACAG